MLEIRVDDAEFFDEDESRFVSREGFVLELEHSLVSLSKWESFWKVPFLGPNEKTTEQVLHYIECMHQGEKLPKNFADSLSAKDFSSINEYIQDTMTATTFREIPGKGKGSPKEIITSELIYYWMISYQIPVECERWHIRRLLTLIEVFSRKNEKPKKMSKAEVAAQYRDLNAQRKAQLGTRG